MKGFLLDTNVVAEAARPVPSPSVIAFLADRIDLWLSVIVLYELEYGVARMPAGRRRDAVRAGLMQLAARYHHRLLPIGREEAGHAARLRVHARHAGRKVQIADTLIAGTAVANGLVVATRNVEDFASFDIEVLNPWTVSGA